MSLEPINNASIQNFQIEYSNKFFQFAINNRIKALENQIEIAYDYTKGSGAETNFENKIIKTILFSSKSIFGQKNYHKRIVFSLVGKTNNSENTIRMHREREKKNYLYEFYDLKEYSEKIDDIDFEFGSNQIKLDENLYLITQASKTGRSFDFAILKRIDKNEWFLYIFQATINKYGELKTKSSYVDDCIRCEKYLSNLYKINIKKKYFIFVIPFNSYEGSFVMELEKRKIYYIFYKSNQFYDKKENVIYNLNFPGAEII